MKKFPVLPIALLVVIVLVIFVIASNPQEAVAPDDTEDPNGQTQDDQDTQDDDQDDQEEVDTSSDNISITAPTPNQQISSPVTIEGAARVFENVFQYRIKESNGTIIAEGTGYANSPDIGQFGPFLIEQEYPEPSTAEGSIEVFVFSAEDGSVSDLVSIPVQF